jgi:mannose-6-phosphate isomerase
MQQLTARPVDKPEWGSTELEPWFPNSRVKIGEVWFEGPADCPLLVKFLFTTAPLSVQVHPDDAYARRHHNSPGKTEMWHILAAQPGARIAAGFREPIPRERLQEAALSGEIEHLLAWYEARPGNTFFIPAGVVHAIGAGLVLCEIQQASDITYRLYDYGRPRELHLEHGVAVSHLGPHAARAGARVECPYFTTQHLVAPTSIPALDREQTLVFIRGEGSLNGRSARAGEVFRLAAGESAVIEGTLALLRTYV